MLSYIDFKGLNSQESLKKDDFKAKSKGLNALKVPFIFEENRDLPIIFFKISFQNAGKAYESSVNSASNEINSAKNVKNSALNAKNSAVQGLKNNATKTHANIAPAGTARMFARLLNEGVDEKFFKDLEFYAINLNASSGFESFEISLSCLKEHFEFALKKLAELLKSPQFDEKLLAKLKTTALGELATRNSDFDYIAKRLLNKSVFECDEFALSNDGDEKSIAKIALKDLQGFHKNLLCLANACVIAGGDISQKECEALIKPVLGVLSVGQKPNTKKFTLCEKLKDEICTRKDSEQAYIYFCSPFELEFSDKNAHLAKLAIFILGAGGFGSRLMEEVRVKRGLAYSAYAMLDLSVCYKRVFGYLQTKNESASEAKALVRSVFSDFVKKGVTQNELTQAQNFLIGSTPLRYESLEKRLGNAYNEFYQGLEIGHFKRELDKIKTATLSELNAYIKAHGELLKLSFASVAR